MQVNVVIKKNPFYIETLLFIKRLYTTLLFFPAQIGNAEIVKFLLKKGADFNAIDSLGWNPLEHARVFGHKEVEKLLIEVSRRIGKILAFVFLSNSIL